MEAALSAEAVPGPRQQPLILLAFSERDGYEDGADC